MLACHLRSAAVSLGLARFLGFSMGAARGTFLAALVETGVFEAGFLDGLGAVFAFAAAGRGADLGFAAGFFLEATRPFLAATVFDFFRGVAIGDANALRLTVLGCDRAKRQPKPQQHGVLIRRSQVFRTEAVAKDSDPTRASIDSNAFVPIQASTPGCQNARYCGDGPLNISRLIVRRDCGR